MIRQIFLDTETTGIGSDHRLIEIGALEMINRRLTGKKFHTYLNPERLVDIAALAVHGLNDAFLADKPKFIEVSEALLEFIEGAELIIHNAAFDLGFLNLELNKSNAAVTEITSICSITDTLLLARRLHPGQKNSLDALCKRYRIDNRHRTLHGALLDAQILSQVYLAMTGGQSNFFNELETQRDVSANQKNQVDFEQFSPQEQIFSQDYIVLKPTEEELNSHKTWIKTQIAKKSS